MFSWISSLLESLFVDGVLCFPSYFSGCHIIYEEVVCAQFLVLVDSWYDISLTWLLWNSEWANTKFSTRARLGQPLIPASPASLAACHLLTGNITWDAGTGNIFNVSRLATCRLLNRDLGLRWGFPSLPRLASFCLLTRLFFLMPIQIMSYLFLTTWVPVSTVLFCHTYDRHQSLKYLFPP